MRNRKPKSGYVYFGESIRKNGRKMEYVGSTTRSIKVREAEHQREVSKTNSRTWTGQGTSFKVKSSLFSYNPRKAERTIKNNKAAKFNSAKRYW